MKAIPKWLMPSKKIIKDFKVLLKAFLKGAIIAGSGALTIKLGGEEVAGLAVAGITHALIKIIDPSDKSIGINKE